MRSYIINPAGLCYTSLHVHSYILTLATQHYDYLPTYAHSYIHDMHTYVMQHVIVQCIVIASVLYCYNYLPSWYLYVRSNVINNLFILFPSLVAGLVYQHSVRNGTTIEANSQFSQFVSLGPLTTNYYSYYYCLLSMLGLIFGYVASNYTTKY